MTEGEQREAARREWEAAKAERDRLAYQEECPHDEHDHGICLDCGKDILDDLIARADLLRE
jgi:hypothetical protein